MKNIYLVAFLIFSSVFAFAQKKDFKIYNAILFDDTPSLKQYGILDFNMIYEDGLITTNYKVKEAKAPTRRFVDEQKVIKAASKSLAQDVPVCLDVEHWDLNKKTEKAYSTARYLELINNYRQIDSKNLVSVFHYGAVAKPIYDASNVIYPAFYMQTDQMKDWYDKVNYFLRNTKKFGGNKPVYALVWPQYNTTKKNNHKPFSMIEKKLWRAQLEYLYQRCDGLVIWTHYRDENGKRIQFDEKSPWFQETLAFIKAKKLNR